MRSNYAIKITEIKFMTMTKTFASKLAIALVAVAMIGVAFASTAKAQTTDELQAMINDLLAQVAALQAGAGMAADSTSSVCPYTWTRDLSQGSTGSDVMMLQQFLNSDADTRVAATGAGSAGMETEYYGPATAAAVSKFQVKYRSEVLSPSNLVNPTGYFGPSSRAKANAQCVAAPVVEDDEEVAVDDEEVVVEEDTELSGEASLDNFDVDSAEDDTIEEGAEDAELGTFQVTFTDGDASISRIDVTITDGATTADAWDAFDTISLWVDGDKVAEENADSKSDYLGDEDNETIRFSGLDLVGMDDEELSIVVAGSIQNNLDSAELTTWTLSADALRFFDGEGVATTENGTLVTSDSETFTLETAGTDDEIIVKTSSNDPDGTTLQVKDNKNSDWYTVHTFDLDTDDSVNDITLNKVPVTVVVSSSTFDTLVDDYELVIDGTTIDSLADNNGSTAGDYTDSATVVLLFDVDGDVVIDAGDRVEAELRLRFNSLDLGNEGVTVTGKVTSANADAIDAEGADDLTTAQLSGSATGDAQTLRTEGLVLDLSSITETKTEASYSGDTDTGTYVFKFDVEAFSNEFYTDEDSAVVNFDLLVDGVAAPAASSSAVLDISGAEDGATADKLITEGDTVNYTLTIETDSSVSGTAKVVVNSVAYSAADDATEELSADALPATDWTSESLILN